VTPGPINPAAVKAFLNREYAGFDVAYDLPNP